MSRPLRLAMSILLVFAFAFSSQAQVQLPTKKVLTLEAAKSLASTVTVEAVKNKWTMVMAVVDDGGNLLLLERMDHAQIGSIEVAIQKAKTAIAFKRSTKTFEERTLAGRTVLLGLPGVVPIEGGLPIIVDGQFIGALGVSGGSSEQDGLAAKAAVDAFSAK
jgi:glc operon protein GlcG